MSSDPAPARILVVDDIEANRAMLSRRLTRRGYEVVEAADGHAALAAVEVAEFDLILLDIMMPGLSGIDVLERLRQTHAPSMLPVIMVTAKTESESIVEALGKGANDYVTKPVDFQVAVVRIQTQIARRRAEIALRRANEDLERRIAERTRDLSSMNDSLVEEIRRRRETEESLRDATARAEAASEAKSAFIANMSHELRTPLNAIIGFSEMIKDTVLGASAVSRYSEYAGYIHDSGNHLLNVVNDILDFSKVQSGKTVLHEDDVSLPHLVRSATSLVEPQAAKRNIAIEVNWLSPIRIVVADQILLKRAFINILANAVKFSHDGGTVAVSVESYGSGKLRLIVADRGVGMNPDDIPRVLQPFVQAETKLSRSFEGTGLGLPLAKSLIELHGGSIEIDSEPNVGTTVCLVLPADRTVEEPPSAAVA